MTSILNFFAEYTKAGIGTAPASPPTIAIYRINRFTDVEQAVVTTGTATTARTMAGRYSYRLNGADLFTYDYHARFSTTDSTMDSPDLPGLWVRWSEAIASDGNGKVPVVVTTDDSGAVDLGIGSGMVVSSPAPTVDAFSATGVGLTARSGSYNGKTLEFRSGPVNGSTPATGKVRRQIRTHTFASPLHNFTFGPGAKFSVPPATGDIFAVTD